MTTRTEWINPKHVSVRYEEHTDQYDQTSEGKALVLEMDEIVAIEGTREELLRLLDRAREVIEDSHVADVIGSMVQRITGDTSYQLGALNRTTPAELLRFHIATPPGIAILVAADQGDDEPPAWAELDEIHEEDDGVFAVYVVGDGLTFGADDEVEWTAVKLPATTPAPPPEVTLDW
jgi:hypothetical protein